MDVVFLPKNGTPFTVDVDFYDTVIDIKQKIEQRHGIPVSDQTFIFNDQVLPDDGDIDTCDIHPHSTITLTVPSDNTAEAPSTSSAPPMTTLLRLRVRIETPETHVLTIGTNANDTVLSLKNKILQAEAALAAANRPLLLYPLGSDHQLRQELQDDRSLAECGVSDGAEIVARLRPTMPGSYLKVFVRSKCGTMRVPVEMNPLNRVKVLRRECERLNRDNNFPLPQNGYFFIHQQAVMEDERSFRWHDVRQNDTIDVFPGHVTYTRRP